MEQRRISGGRLSWLLKELEAWRSENLITPEQATGIRARYESGQQISRRKHSTALIALMGLAAFLIGLAVLLLISYNWQGMPRALKLAIIFGAVGATHFAGYQLRYRRESRVLSEVVFLLGCLLYGAGIFLIAQIFHVNAHYPDLLWWWALGALLVALLMDTVLIHALVAVLLATWCGFEVLGFDDLGFWLFGRWEGIPNGAYSLPLLVFAGLLWAYRKNSATTVALYVPVLSWWVVLQPFAWDWEAEAMYFIGAVGALLLIVAETHTRGSRLAIPYRVWGALISAGILVPLSFHEVNQELAKGSAGSAELLPTLLILGLAVLVLIVAADVQRSRTSSGAALPGAVIALLRRQLLPPGLILLMAILPLWNSAFREPNLPTLICNVAMIGLALWLIQVGLRDDRGLPFAGGVVYFLLWAVLRYVDLFGDFGGMLGASLMFFLCGATLFGVALFWRKRKGVQLDP